MRVLLYGHHLLQRRLCVKHLQTTAYNNLAATNPTIKSMVNQNNDSTKFQRNVGKVVVYLKTFEYELIAESPAYEVSDAKNVY